MYFFNNEEPCIHVARDNQDLNNEYENFVHTGAYDYGEFFEEINFAARIIEALDQNQMVQGLGKMFHQEFRDQFPSRGTRKNAFHDAKILALRSQNPTYAPFKGKKGLFEAVKEAVSKGYIWKFIIDVPWHASFFFRDDQIYTFPFQHRYAVLYSGQAKHIFFDEFGKYDLLREDDDVNNLYKIASSEEWVEYIAEEEGIGVQKFREKVHNICSSYDGDIPEGAAVNRLAKKYGLMTEYRNPDSILNEGALLTGNQHVNNEDDYNDGAEEKAVWLAFIDKAKNYPAQDEGAKKGKAHPKLYQGSHVFEVEVPSNWLAIKGNKGTNAPRLETVEDCLNSYESPMDMSKDLSRNDEWVVPDTTGRLPLHYIKGVWDKGEFPGAPHFMSLESFVDLMEQKYSERMPGGQTHVERGDVSKKELDVLKNEFEELERIRNWCSSASEASEKIESQIESIEEILEELSEEEKEIKELEKKEQKLEEIVEEEKKKEEKRWRKLRELKDKGEDASHINSGMTEKRREAGNKKSKVEDKLERLINWRKRSLEQISTYFGALQTSVTSRNSTLEGIQNELSKNGIDAKLNETSLQEFLKKAESQDKMTEESIATEIMEVHKKAAKKWEENKHKTEVITEKMESDLRDKSKNFRIVETSLKEIYSLLSTQDLADETKQKLKESLKKEWRKE